MALLTCAIAPVSAKAQEQERPVFVFGLGADTCAYDEQPQHARQASSWALGFFTGLNAGGYAGLVRDVGSTTDDEGIISEINSECFASPDETTLIAVEKLYLKILHDEQ